MWAQLIPGVLVNCQGRELAELLDARVEIARRLALLKFL